MEESVVKKLDIFFKNYKHLKFKKGETLVQADANPPGLFYLTEGVVKQCVISKKGEEQTLNLFKSPSLFPIAWIINDTPNSHYYEAVTPVSVWLAPKKAALDFLKGTPQILFDLLQRIYRGLDGYFTRMENLMHGNARDKLVAELLIYAKRFGKKEAGSIIIDIKLTENLLASQAGIARETVSREIKKLQKEGLIAFAKNKLTITNLDKLQEALPNGSK